MTSITERVQREHEERQARRERILATEKRLDRYRSNIFTPSGRPYESLPVVSLKEMRKQIKTNAIGLHGLARADC